MQLELKLYVREHRSGFLTVRVIGGDGVEAYARSLDDVRQDLELVLGDRIERTHPSLQASFLPIAVDRLEKLEIPNVLPVGKEAEDAKTSLVFSVLVAESRSFVSLWIPRPNLHLWIPKKSAGGWEKAARELLVRHLEGMSATELLALRWEKKEWVEPLVLEAEPPPLTAFTGKNRGLFELPIRPVDEEEEEEEETDPEDSDDDEPKKKNKGKKRKKVETPTLKKIGVNLAQLAEIGDLPRAHGRQRDLDALLGILSTPGEKAIAVVGPSGVGKSALLDELVHRLRAEGTPAKLKRRPIFFVDASRLIARDDAFFGADWMRQCLDVIAECEAAKVIWYIGPLLPLLDAGKHIYSEQNVSLLLKPYLASKRLMVIGECSEKDFARLELRDAAFARTFTPYRLQEPERAEARDILEKVAAELRDGEGIDVRPGGLDAVEELSRRYVSEGSHFGASIHFLRRTVEAATARGEAVLERRDVVRAFSSETGLPERLVRDDLPLDPAEVEAAFRGRLVGQDEAVRRMVDLVAVIKAGLSDLGRPLGSFLFIGPTGVGKTETAKALAQYLFGGDHRMIRFDMSEYAGWDAVHRFLGDAETEGKLVEAIRRRPFSVVLLDEIEKASPAIFDVLLQVLGEARLTDEAGRTADFKNAVIVMTSNLGVESYKPRTGFDPAAELTEHFRREAERFFRPELFNRIDHLVPFVPLEAEAIGEITRREVKKLLGREGIRQRRLQLRVGPDALAWLAERGVEPKYGARPLKRVIERTLTVPLARRLATSKATPPGLSAQIFEGGLQLVEDASSSARSPDDGGEPPKAAEELLRAHLAAIDRVRFRAGRWLESEDFASLNEDLRLLDQLGQHKTFWDNRALAEERMRGVEDKRALRDGWLKLEADLGSLEDLAYEAFWNRDAAHLDTMEGELRRLQKELDGLEIRLYERRWPTPDAVVVYLMPTGGAASLMHKLVGIYGRIAFAEGWKLAVHEAFRPDKAQAANVTPPPKPERAAYNPAGKKEEPRVPKQPKKEKVTTLERERVIWRPRAELSLERETGDPDTDEQRAVRGLLEALGSPNERMESALLFEGPHVAAVLGHEDGEHHLVSSSEADLGARSSAFVRVAVRPRSAGLLHPADIGIVVGARARTIQENKRQVVDHGLDAHVPIEPRLHRIYRRFMRRHMIHAVFGARAAAWSKLWED